MYHEIISERIPCYNVQKRDMFIILHIRVLFEKKEFGKDGLRLTL